MVSQSYLTVLVVVVDLCHYPSGGVVSGLLGVGVVFGYDVVIVVIVVVVVVVGSGPRWWGIGD